MPSQLQLKDDQVRSMNFRCSVIQQYTFRRSASSMIGWHLSHVPSLSISNANDSQGCTVQHELDERSHHYSLISSSNTNQKQQLSYISPLRGLIRRTLKFLLYYSQPHHLPPPNIIIHQHQPSSIIVIADDTNNEYCLWLGW